MSDSQHFTEKTGQRRLLSRDPLAKKAPKWFICQVTAQTFIKQFKALPPKERAEVAKFVVESEDSWIQESFKQGMADAEAGRFADMDAVLNDSPPPSRRRAK